MSAAVVHKIASEQNDVGVGFRSVVGAHEALVPVAEADVDSLLFEIFLIDVGPDIDVNVREVSDAKRWSRVATNEQWVEKLAARVRCGVRRFVRAMELAVLI